MEITERIDKNRFFYPSDRYHGQFQPEYLLFNANLQEFTQRASYIYNLQNTGKISPQEAFKRIEEFQPDIMLCDLYLQKGLSGIEILKKAKAMKPDIKVVMQTGFGEQKQIEHDCIRFGALKFLYKPMRPKEILEEIDKI